MPFDFQPYRSPFASSIADLILRRGDIAAHRSEQIGNALSQSALASGQAWAHALSDVGQTVGNLPLQLAAAKRADLTNQLIGGQVADMQSRQRGNATVDAMMQGDQLAPGAVGPRQDSYLDQHGLFDIPKMTQALGSSGLGHLAPDLLKGAESINDSILKHQQIEQQAAAQHAIMLGDTAAGALKLADAGTPVVQAMDFAVQPLLATKRIDPAEYQQVKAQIQALPPEQQRAALTTFMDQAAKLDKGENLSEGAQHVDRYGRVTASGAPKPPTKPSLAAAAASGDAMAQAALDKLTPPKNPPSLEEQYVTAVAKGDTATADTIRQTWADKAKASRDPVATAQLEAIRNLTQREAQQRLEDANPQSPKNQQKFEQEYRTVLQRGLSSRSGGLGLEDAKVQQANHLLSLLDQNFDPKTGEWNIPRVQLNELALGLARLTSPGGQAGEQLMREFQQRTAKGDIAGALTYLTGSPVPANTQALTKYLKDSIERQGQTAEQNREGEMRYLRGLAPTDLAEERRQALEANSLNPLRQSRLMVGPNGQQRLFVSIDGGKTWQ